MSPTRVVFLGSDPIALPLLAALAATPGVAFAGVFTQPDRAAGRGQQVQPNAIKEWALARGLPVQQPLKLTGETEAELARWAPDLAVVMAYGQILPDRFIAVPRLGTVNLHTSILPRYRGASPIQTAVAAGETETGVSLMRLVRALDAGPVAAVERVPVAPRDTAREVEAKLALASARVVAAAWPRLAAGTLEFVAQDAAAATFCRRLKKEDGVLDFHAPAAVLAARVRGLFPWPGTALEAGGVTLKIGLATATASPPGPEPAGTVLAADARGIAVATGAGILWLENLQRPGGRMLPAGDFLRGFPLAVGTRLESRPMPPLLRAG